MSYESNIRKMYAFKFFRALFFMGGVLIPFFTDWAGITFSQIMILNSVYLVSVFIMEIPTGAVADYFGRKASIICSGFVMAVAALVYSSYPSFYVLLVGEIIWATSFALGSGADQALVYDSLKKIKREKESKKIFGRFASFELAAITVAAPIGSIIAAYAGLRYTVMLMAVPSVIAGIIGFTFKEPKTKKKVESTRYIHLMLNGMKYFRSHKELKILAFDAISVSIFVFFLIWIYQPFLQEMNFPLIYFGFVHAGIALAEVIVMNNFERFEKLFGSKKRFILWSALIPGASFIIVGLTGNVAVAIILFFVIGGIGLSRYVLFQSYMNKYIESHHRATVMSTISMTDKIFRAMAYPIVGLMVEHSLRFSFVAIGVIIIIFALVSKVEEEHLID